MLGPALYLLYTRDIHHDYEATMATFADDTAIIATEEVKRYHGVEEVTEKHEEAISRVNNIYFIYKTNL